MNILLVAATEAEIAPCKAHMETVYEQVSEHVYADKSHTITLLVTGVGMVAATYNLTKTLTNNLFDFVLQAGIGGSFGRNILLGDVVFISSEQFGDTGAEDHDKHIDIFDLGLLTKDAFPFSGTQLKNPMVSEVHKKIALPTVSSLTVSMVTGNDQTVARLVKDYNCQVESMEGAPLHYVCLTEGIAFAQIRSISNYVEARDKSKWQIGKAIKNLNEWLINFLAII